MFIRAMLVLLLVSSVCAGDRIALVINGGYGLLNNYSGLTKGVQEWYQTLLGLGYTPENIYVLDSDGPDNNLPPWTNPMPKPWFSSPYSEESREYDCYFGYTNPMGRWGLTWVDSPKDYDGDGITDTRYDSTVESFDRVTQDMATGSPDDELLVILSSHGGADPVTGKYIFGIWDYVEKYPGDFVSRAGLIGGNEIESYLDRIPYSKRLVLVNTCHSEVANQHFANDKTAVMVNAQAEENGWVRNPVLDLSGWYPPYPFEGEASLLLYTMPKGLRGEAGSLPDGSMYGVTADLNDDGKITWGEVWTWAYEENEFGPNNPNPLWVEDFNMWATEHPLLLDPNNLTEDWVVVQFISGDANKDGTVDLQDFGILKVNFGGPGCWSQGDFNGDGAVDLQDFGLLKASFGGVCAVPEPATAGGLMLGSVVLLARRRHATPARVASTRRSAVRIPQNRGKRRTGRRGR